MYVCTKYHKIYFKNIENTKEDIICIYFKH